MATAAQAELDVAIQQLINTRDGLDTLVAHGADESSMLETLAVSEGTLESYKEVKSTTLKLVGATPSAKVLITICLLYFLKVVVCKKFVGIGTCLTLILSYFFMSL